MPKRSFSDGKVQWNMTKTIPVELLSRCLLADSGVQPTVVEVGVSRDVCRCCCGYSTAGEPWANSAVPSGRTTAPLDCLL